MMLHLSHRRAGRVLKVHPEYFINTYLGPRKNLFFWVSKAIASVNAYPFSSSPPQDGHFDTESRTIDCQSSFMAHSPFLDDGLAFLCIPTPWTDVGSLMVLDTAPRKPPAQIRTQQELLLEPSSIQ